jgi:hypothetical protein
MSRGRSIYGYTHHRQPWDFYRTPRPATQALLDRERFQGYILEPAAGDGAIVEVLEQGGYKVLSSDIRTGTDFLVSHRIVDNLVTNPPYRVAHEFVSHAKRVALKKIAMLLRLDFLHGSGRYELFQDRNFPLARVYVFSRRLQFSPDNTGSPMMSHAWFVWDRSCHGSPRLGWIA